jgi:prepilin-type N-terminal cleavage/methylation domain-containing protein
MKVSREHRRSGFTLLELLIVLALVASLASLSWPRLQGSLARAERDQVVQQVQTMFAEARGRALERAQPHLVRYDTDRSQITLYELRLDEVSAENFAEPQSAWDAPQARPADAAALSMDEPSERHHAIDAPLRASGIADLSVVLIDAVNFPEGFQLVRVPETETSEPIGLPIGGELNALGDEPQSSPSDRVSLETSQDLLTSPGFLFVVNADGRTEDAQLELRDPRQITVSLKLWGATGELVAGDRRTIPAADRGTEPSGSDEYQTAPAT